MRNEIPSQENRFLDRCPRLGPNPWPNPWHPKILPSGLQIRFLKILPNPWPLEQILDTQKYCYPAYQSAFWSHCSLYDLLSLLYFLKSGTLTSMGRKTEFLLRVALTKKFALNGQCNIAQSCEERTTLGFRSNTIPTLKELRNSMSFHSVRWTIGSREIWVSTTSKFLTHKVKAHSTVCRNEIIFTPEHTHERIISRLNWYHYEHLKNAQHYICENLCYLWFVPL